MNLSEQLQTSRHLRLCTQSGSSGSCPVGVSSGHLQPLSSSAAPAASPPSPGLWLLSVSPSPPSSPWLSVCPPLSLPLIGVFVQDSAWQAPRIEPRSIVHLVPETMGGACALGSDSALNLRRHFRSCSSHLSLSVAVFQCRFRRIQICPMCWLCAVLTFQRLPMSIKLPKTRHHYYIKTKRNQNYGVRRGTRKVTYAIIPDTSLRHYVGSERSMRFIDLRSAVGVQPSIKGQRANCALPDSFYQQHKHGCNSLECKLDRFNNSSLGDVFSSPWLSRPNKVNQSLIFIW